MKRQQGFVLVEVLIAVIILSVGLVAVAGVFLPTTANYAAAADYTVATNLAQKQLELLKTYADWDAAVTAGQVQWQGEEPPPQMPIKLNGVDYTVITKVSTAAVSNSLVEVTVTVAWSRGGKAQSSQFTAFFSKI